MLMDEVILRRWFSQTSYAHGKWVRSFPDLSNLQTLECAPACATCNWNAQVSLLHTTPSAAGRAEQSPENVHLLRDCWPWYNLTLPFAHDLQPNTEGWSLARVIFTCLQSLKLKSFKQPHMQFKFSSVIRQSRNFHLERQELTCVFLKPIVGSKFKTVASNHFRVCTSRTRTSLPTSAAPSRAGFLISAASVMTFLAFRAGACRALFCLAGFS
jgi:hypothetical protein